MVNIQSRIILLITCIAEAAWLLLAQTSGSTLLLLPCLACFLALVAWTAIQGMALPVLMFFLPFSTLLKLRPGMISVFTIGLLLAYLVYTVRGIKNISIKHMVPALALMAMVLVVKTLYGEAIDNGFVLFFLSLLSVPFFKRELGEKYDFYYLTVGFAVGIVIAALTARYLMGFPTIRQYIRTHEYTGMVRYSGYYGDPNYYSAHVTAALCGVLVLMTNTAKKLRVAFLMIFAVLLVYCGSLAVSKSFWLICIAGVMVWILTFLFQKGKLTAKITIFLALLVGVALLLSSTIFNEQVAMIIFRFSQDRNISDLTTKRTELWNRYMEVLLSDAKLLVFGRGMSQVLINDRAAHNTLIECVYQLGIVGSSALIVWFVCYVRSLLNNTVIAKKKFGLIAVLLIGVIGPWMGLDVLRADEFFLMPMYICVGLVFLSQQTEETELTFSATEEQKV